MQRLMDEWMDGYDMLQPPDNRVEPTRKIGTQPHMTLGYWLYLGLHDLVKIC